MHRLRLLLVNTKGCSLTDKSADLLFGPLVNWMTAGDAARAEVPGTLCAMYDAAVISGDISQYAREPPERELAASARHFGAKYLVALRMCVFWKLYEVYAPIFPSESLFPYYIGIAMDLHQPALRLDNPTVCAIYSSGNGSGRIATESVLITDIVNDDVSDQLLPPHILEELWREHLNCNRTRKRTGTGTVALCEVNPVDGIGGRRGEVSMASASRKNSRRKTGHGSDVLTTAQKRKQRKASVRTTIPSNSAVASSAERNKKTHITDLQALLQLIPKGMLNPLSTRYIMKSVEDGLKDPPNPMVMRIIKTFVLGAYQHVSKSIAPPLVRTRMYNATSDDLLQIMLYFKPKQAYTIIAEFVTACTTHHESLAHILSDDPVYRAYSKRAIDTSDAMLRAEIHEHILHTAIGAGPEAVVEFKALNQLTEDLVTDITSEIAEDVVARYLESGKEKGGEKRRGPSRLGACSRKRKANSSPQTKGRDVYSPTPLDTGGKLPRLLSAQEQEQVAINTALSPPLQRSFWELARVLDVKVVLDQDVVDLGTKAFKSVPEFYKILRGQPQTLRIYRGILRQMKMEVHDMDIIAKGLININSVRVAKHLNGVINKLSPEGRAKLHLYVHYIAHRSQITCQRIHTRRVIPPVREDQPSPYILVCNTCATIRSQCAEPTSSKKNSKTRSTGTKIDTYKGIVVCGACESEDIGIVDTRYYYVSGPTPQTPTTITTFCRCHRCGKITPYGHVIGTTEFCTKCYYVVASQLVIRQCFCGAPISAEDTTTRKIMAINEHGETTIYGVCTKHLHVLTKFNPSDTMPIQAYHALIE